jgi:hypothetical protein
MARAQQLLPTGPTCPCTSLQCSAWSRTRPAARASAMNAAPPAAPFLSDQIFVHVAQHLACRELGRLACTASRFSLLCPIGSSAVTSVPATQPAAERLSIVAEGARRRLRGHTLRACVPRRGTESWLRLLRELERLERPAFTLSGPDVALRDGGRTALRLSGGTTHAQQHFLQSAVCAGVDLRAGRHFLELTWVNGPRPRNAAAPAVASPSVATALGLDEDQDEDDDPMLCGVCGPSFDPTAQAGGAPSMVSNDPTASLFSARSGRLRQWSGLHGSEVVEQDWPGRQSVLIGDVIGLLLDLDEGSLAVYRNGERLGLMVRGGLVPPLRWCVDLDPEDRTQVSVRAAPVPSVVTNLQSSGGCSGASDGSGSGSGSGVGGG